jgi:hypothetical protein
MTARDFPVIRVELHMSKHKPFLACVDRLSSAFLDDPTSVESLFHLLQLPRLGLTYGLTLGNKYARHMAAYPHIETLSPRPRSDRMSIPLPDRVEAEVKKGNLSRAARLLSPSNPIAPLNDTTRAKLQSLHPAGPLDPFGKTTPPRHGPAIFPDSDLIQTCFASIKRETAPGPSGWTQPLLKLAMEREKFREFLVLYARMVARGDAPGRELMLACRGTPLDKDGKWGVRPIAVGELMWNVIAKSLLALYARSDCLLPWQLGVKSPGGVEPVVRAVELMVDGEVEREFVCQLDMTNAYNSASRVEVSKAGKKYCPQLWRTSRWAYGAETSVVFIGADGEVELVESSSGVRQGDPLAPFLFSLAIRDTLSALKAHLTSLYPDSPPPIILAYLDDIVILTNDPSTIDHVAAFLSSCRSSLSLNQSKSTIDHIDDIRSTGITLLGTAVGSKEFRRAFLKKKVSGQVQLLDQLPSLAFQPALLLLRQCIQHNLRHLQRCLKTIDMPHCWDELDRELQHSLLVLRSSPRSLPTDSQIISLPTRLGGLGILSFDEVAPHARAAALESADRFLAPLLGLPLDDDDTPLTSQRTRCATVLETRHATLLSSLPPHHHSFNPIIIFAPLSLLLSFP